MPTYFSPIDLIKDRIYLFHVEGVKPIPVIFKKYEDEEKGLCHVIIYGQKGITHFSCLYMTKIIKEN